MNIYKESEKIITYRGNTEGKYYEVEYNKINNVITIKIDSSVLSYEHYKRVVGKIYESAVKEIKNFKDVRFEFYPANEKENKNADSVIKYFEINNKSSVIGKNDKINRSIDEYFKANMVTKNENGHIKQYVERKVSNNNQEYMLEVTLDEMKEELNNMLSDNSVNIDDLSDIEIANMVMDRIANRKKQYYLERSDKHDPKNAEEEAALNVTDLDDRVNTEIGVVRKDPEEAMGNSYRAIERDGDNYNVVNPSINAVSSIEGGNNNSDDVDLTSNEVEGRDEEKVYYLDNNNGDIYKGEYKNDKKRRDQYKIKLLFLLIS